MHSRLRVALALRALRWRSHGYDLPPAGGAGYRWGPCVVERVSVGVLSVETLAAIKPEGYLLGREGSAC